jgi:electron transfer flavoprotein alpha subunit/quercetin dioxygenase-like cupin family protein
VGKNATKGKGKDPHGRDRYQGVWVLGDIRTEATKKATASLMERAAVLATKRAADISLVLLGKDLSSTLPFFEKCGADRIYLMDHQRLAVYRQETYTGALAHLVNKSLPEIFLLLANDCGRELAPRLAARLNTGLCADCIGLDIDPDTGLLEQTVPAFGDHIYGKVTTPHRRPQMATVRPGDLMADEPLGPASEKRDPEVQQVRFPSSLIRERVKWLGSEKDTESGHALEDARIVVCGGRGMSTGSRFHSLWELARLMGAEVGATRPAVHAHWIDEDRMIGQTGHSVAPEVLLVFGISGATQFTAAVQQARYIVAVNRDPKAAIFTLADLGVVGDAKQILPELIRRLQRTLMEHYGKSREKVLPQETAALRGGLGRRWKDLREDRGYTLDEIAQALEVSPHDVETIEENQAAPSVSLLLRFAQLMRVDPAPFLTMADGTRADRRRVESFTKRTQNYSYRTLTPGAEQKHLRAFRVTIDPKRDHKMIEYKHEGEEFVYVLRGEAEIKVGEETRALKRGDSLHFEASIPHHLRNPSAQKTELIVVLYTP